MDVGSLVIVTQDFISEIEDELSLFAGDVVQIIEVPGKLWFRGVSNGVEGRFPKSYVREKPLPCSWDTRKGYKLFAALADFMAVQHGDLGFTRGDLIIGIEPLDDNWWNAEDVDGNQGTIPVTHVWSVDVDRLPKQEDFNVNRRARVILTMTAQLNDELDLVKDELVTVRRIIDRDWYWGENDAGRQGRFPKSFVSLLEETVADFMDLPPSFEECVSKMKSPKTSSQQSSPCTAACTSTQEEYGNKNNLYQNLNELNSSEGYGGSNGIQPYARTKYKFTSQYPNELTFEVGQIVHLIRHIDDEWMEGQLDDKVGLFPTEYVDIIVDVAHDLPNIAGTLAKALYDFDSSVEGDLQMKEGEAVVILEKVSDEWFKARNSRGEIGICPISYVKKSDPNTGSSAALISEAVTSGPSETLIPLGQERVVTWLEASSPPPTSSATGLESGETKSVAVFSKKDRKEKSEIRSQNSTPVEDEEDFSWDFGSPDHFAFKSNPIKTIPVCDTTTLSGDEPIDKSKFIPARPPPPPPAKANEKNHPQRSAPPVPFMRASRYENCVSPTDVAGQAAAKDLVEKHVKEDSRALKRKEHRQCVFTEIIQTEKDYNQDLKLCFSTFLKDPSHARRLGIDTVTLFGNMDEVIEVSSQLLERMEKEKLRPEDEQRVGTCFIELVARLQDIYSHYCRNHDDVSGLLAKYERHPEINLFLKNGVDVMQRNSNCFDLGSVLIKPVQRILKYPLLINELEKATEDSHPDKLLLLKAMDDMSKVATDINEVKRRKDLVSKYRTNPDATFSQKLSKLNLHSVKKKSTRFSVKMSSSLGFTTVVRDEEFEREEHRLLLLERSIKNCLKSMRLFCEQLEESLKVGLQLSEDICDFYAEKCNLPDRYRSAHHIVYADIWSEFTRTVNVQVLDTLHSVLEMLITPQKIISKREHKLLDLAACTARMEKNRDATRQKAFEEEEQSARNMYNALNSQLLDELPKLCSLSTDILRSCVDTLLRARKLLVARITKQLLELSELPELTNTPVNVLEGFETKHRAALQTFAKFSMTKANTSSNLFKIESFARSGNFIRKSFNDKYGTALDLVPQTEAQKQWLKEEYGQKVYVVAITIQSSDTTEISLNKGDIVGVIRQADPSGNPMRWYVDNGRCKGLIASKHLLRSNVNNAQRTSMEVIGELESPVNPTTSSMTNEQSRLANMVEPTGAIYGNISSDTTSSVFMSQNSPHTRETEATFELKKSQKSEASLQIRHPNLFQHALLPSKKVVNPIISNLPNRSSMKNNSNNSTGLLNFEVPPSSAMTSQNSKRLNKPLPALPTEDVSYSNLEIMDDGGVHHDPKCLIDDRQKVDEYYYALYKLEEVGPGQLTLTQGQVVLVIYKSDLENNSEWWFVEDRYGNQGYVPATYLKKYKN